MYVKNSKVNSKFDFGFVIPVEAEAKPLLRLLKNKKVFRYGMRRVIAGLIWNKKVCMIISGCGKIKSASATQLLIDNYRARAYIHYGIAGAISDSLSIGDVILAKEVIEHDVIELFPVSKLPPIYITDEKFIKMFERLNHANIIIGRILSGDEDIIMQSRKDELFKQYKGLTVDWESAGFTLSCKMNNVRYLVLRGVSDLAHEHTIQEYRLNQSLAVNNIIKFILNSVFEEKLVS